MKKSLIIIIAIVLAATMGIIVYAKNDSKAASFTDSEGNTYTCGGGLEVSDTYSATGNTVASSGRSGDDFVYVKISFDEYNPKFDASYENENTGENATSVSVSATGWNPDDVYGNHVIKRNGATFRLDTHVTQP